MMCHSCHAFDRWIAFRIVRSCAIHAKATLLRHIRKAEQPKSPRLPLLVERLKKALDYKAWNPMNVLARIYEPEDLERPSIRRGGLTLIFDPLEFWLGDVQVKLSPLEGALMQVLMQRGRANWEIVDGVLRGGASSATIRDVLVHRIRRKFVAAGGNDPLETVRGWGLKLRVPPDDVQSTSVWIGVRKPAF